MADLVNLYIDDVRVSVPKGTVVVDAAKQANIEVPVFCYHPKLKPVGMCRMCLVQIGRPKIDRATRQPVLDANGQPEIGWGPKLETSCTTPVEEGMHVRTITPEVKRAQKDVLEFLLTSHPLDCPICDKGGECPLQNLTLGFGPGRTRFDYDDKQHLDKHYPLGELIFLDRERCIQCARCIRFQDEIADDHVLGFYQRGRMLQIQTMSEPGFDSKFSGNTTDICPVGALTTADFRFRARPWEMTNVASICPHCPVGCNITLGTRRSSKGGGDWEILRVMPRQNEEVNEIWICDKGRFGHHFVRSADRLKTPLVRTPVASIPGSAGGPQGKSGQLVEATWDEALNLVADRLKSAGGSVAGFIGDRLANEDAYLFGKLFRDGLKSTRIANRPHVAGADLVQRYGVGSGTNLGRLGKGAVVLVVAGDVEEAAPVYFLRLKAAAERGATLIVANVRETKLDRYTENSLRYKPGAETQLVYGLLNVARPDSTLKDRLTNYTPAKVAQITSVPEAEITEAGKAIAAAQDLIVVFGDERPYNVMVNGRYTDEGRALPQACANLLIATGHVGKANNGLLPLWPHNNTQGVYDMLSATGAQWTNADGLKVLYIVGSDPVGEAHGLPQAEFTVVQELFLTKTAEQADVVLPALSFAERDGTFTNAERRVQRTYKGVSPTGQARADWEVFNALADRLGLKWTYFTSEAVMEEIAANVPGYTGATYTTLAAVKEEWPPVGSNDLYFGGTAYDNRGGVGLKLPSAVEQDGQSAASWIEPPILSGELIALRSRRLNERGVLIGKSKVYQPRLFDAGIELNSVDAARLGIAGGDRVTLSIDGSASTFAARVDGRAPQGAALVPPDAPGGVAQIRTGRAELDHQEA